MKNNFAVSTANCLRLLGAVIVGLLAMGASLTLPNAFASPLTPPVLQTFTSPLSESVMVADATSDPTGWKLLYTPPVPDLFSGAASFVYPVEAPAGRNGLQPRINLVYSSRAVDGIVDTGAIDPGPIALGWSLNFMDIVREGAYVAGDGAHPVMYSPNQYSLLIDGTGYELQPDTAGADYGVYHAKDLPGYRVERHNDLWGGSATNYGHEYWLVHQPDGTVARLGYTTNSEVWVSRGAVCDDYCGAGTDTDLEVYPYSSTASRWRVDTITDTFSNVMSFTYLEKDLVGSPAFDFQQSRPAAITYNYSNGVGGSRIEFLPTTDQVINDIHVYHTGTLIRKYHLNQSWRWNNTWGQSVGTYVVDSIQELDGSSGVSLPLTTFDYQPYPHINNDSIQFAMLTTINNGYGAITEFSYLTDGRESGNMGQSYRVSETRTFDGLNPSPMRVQYAYGTRCYNQTNTAPAGSAVCTGFGRVESNGPLVGHDVVTRTVLDFNGAALSKEVHRYFTDTGNSPLRGREYSAKTYTGTVLLAENSSTFITTTINATTFTYLSQADSATYDGGVTATQRITYTYDNLGNLGARFEHGDPNVTGDERRTYWEYSTNTDPAVWIVNKPRQESTYSGLTGSLAAQTRYVYDNLPAYTSLPIKGALTRVERWDNTKWITATQTAYDGFGNPLVITDALTHTTTTFYDSQYNLYPVQIVNAAQQTTTMSYDMALGVVTQVTDPNGVATTYAYDTFGRLLRVARPYDSDALPTIEYQYTDAYSVAGLKGLRIIQKFREISGDPNAVRVIHTFYDGLGREVQTRAEAGNGSQQSVANIVYDARGLVQSSYSPAFEAVNADFTRPITWNMRPRTQTQYDALGREIVITNTDNTLVRTAYRGRSTGVLDANGHQRISTADAYGRVVTVGEYTNTLSSVNFTLPAYAATRYAYTTLDSLTRVTDTVTNTTVITYNALNLKTAMLDPDMGLWQYAYDSAGNLTRQTDARGQRICFYYDVLNRLTGKHYRTDDNCPTVIPTLNVTYTYDLGDYAIGRRTAMNDESGSTSWTYDARGRVANATKTLGNLGLFSTGFGYDALDRVTALYYPNGEVVTQTYNAASQLTAISGAAPYASALTYNALSQLKQLNLGNGALTTFAYYGDGGPATNSFRLWRIQTSKGSPLFELQYDYDSVGNVQHITDTQNSNQVQTFTYDALDRLQSAATNGFGDGQFSESYTYNAIGNITNTNRLGNYSYAATASNCSGGVAAIKPHAVSQIVTRTFAYDCNGNMLTRNETGVLYNQLWDAENRLNVVTNTVTGEVTKFLYDGDGARALQIYSGTYTSTTAYLGGVLEIVALGAPPIITSTIPVTHTHRAYLPLVAAYGNPRKLPLANETWKMYYAAGNQLIAMRSLTVTGSTLSYLHADHLGSVSLATDANGVAIPGSRQMYYPYGEPRVKGTSLATDIGFTGQRADATGLMYYQARYYSVIGRFISADTIVPDPKNPQSLNRYSYAYDNPVKYTDPSGHDPWYCDNAKDSSACFDSSIASVTRNKYKARIFYLNQIGQMGRGQIQPSSDPNDFEAYLLYRLGLLVGSENVKHIPIFQGSSIEGDLEMIAESIELSDKYAPIVAKIIQDDLAARPLMPGEKLILVGNSGGGTIAVESLHLLEENGIYVDKAILRGSLVSEGWISDVGQVDYLTSGLDYWDSWDVNPYDSVQVNRHLVGGVNYPWLHVMPNREVKINVANWIISLITRQ